MGEAHGPSRALRVVAALSCLVALGMLVYLVVKPVYDRTATGRLPGKVPTSR